jgi:hypothetical protein
MRKYNYLKPDGEYDFCGAAIVKPLSIHDGIPIPRKYFDEESYLTKTPSYVWHNYDNAIKAFVLNTDASIKDIGLGVNIVGYQSIVKDISFASDILPYVVKHIDIYNEESGFPYDYILFQDDEIARLPSIMEKVKSLGFSYYENCHCFIKQLVNKNAPE